MVFREKSVCCPRHIISLPFLVGGGGRAPCRLTEMHELVCTHLTTWMDRLTESQLSFRSPPVHSAGAPRASLETGGGGVPGTSGAATRSQAPSFPVRTRYEGPSQKSTAVRTLHQAHLFQAESTSGSDQRASERCCCRPYKALRRPPAAT